MNTAIANIIRGKVETLSWADRVAGIVREYVKIDVVNVGDQKARVRKTFPVSCDITNDDCVKGKYADLVPNSSRRAIIYFEDGGTILESVSAGTYRWKSRMTLVCWVNMKRFNFTNPCSISPQLIVSLLEVLPRDEFSESGYSRIKIGFTGEQAKNGQIFNKYTYDEGVSGYLLAPYDYFALGLEITYSTHASCFDEIETDTDDCPTL